MNRPPIAVIPARGGSKRIPRKNIRLMAGKPLIQWTIETALDSGAFADVIVSTEDAEIAEIARAAGAGTPFTRPAELAEDFTSTGEVMAHAVEFMSNTGFSGSDVCCLYPSAIFITSQDLIRSRELLGLENQYVMSVVEYPHPIQRALRIASDDLLTPVDPEAALVRTQDLEPRFHDAGQFYWGKAYAWSQMQPVWNLVKGYRLPAGSVVDIDTEADWVLAERIHATVCGSSSG